MSTATPMQNQQPSYFPNMYMQQPNTYQPNTYQPMNADIFGPRYSSLPPFEKKITSIIGFIILALIALSAVYNCISYAMLGQYTNSLVVAFGVMIVAGIPAVYIGIDLYNTFINFI